MNSHNLVNISSLDPLVHLDIRYATAQNFCQKKLYTHAVSFLHKDCALALKKVQDALVKRDLFLKIFDGYRPLAVQQVMWDIIQDETYVMNPAKGKGRHTRGTAVDVTLVDRSGREIEMPCAFDDFTQRAHRENLAHSDAARNNMKLLEQAMEAEGFMGWPFEWWHFDFNGWNDDMRYPPLDVSFETLLTP